jgi:hypothetical protein
MGNLSLLSISDLVFQCLFKAGDVTPTPDLVTLQERIALLA